MGSSSVPAVVATVDKGEPVEIRVSLKLGRGRTLCEVRAYERLATAGVYLATAHGLAFDVAKVPDLVKALQTALGVSGLE